MRLLCLEMACGVSALIDEFRTVPGDSCVWVTIGLVGDVSVVGDSLVKSCVGR